ncbi:MAG: GldG family protein [Pseudobdellovibrionaceae bacterium]
MSRLGKISLFFSGFSLVAMTVTRYLLGSWVPFCWLALGLFVAFIVLALFVDRKFFKEFFTMKTTKHGMNMGALILLVLAFLVIVNFLAVRNYKTFDFSMAKVNTLSNQSITLLKNLDSELKIRFFYKKGVQGNEENRRLFRDLIKKYQDQSAFVQLDFIEVNERPDLSQEYGVDKGSGIVFLEYKGKRNRIEKIDEQEVTNALVKVTHSKLKTLYFISGHGEKNLEDNQDPSGLNALKLLLENNQYKVLSLALNQNPKIPEDADVVVIAGPTQGFLDFEITALKDYLKKGGSLLLAIEQNSIGLTDLYNALGIFPKNNYIYNIVDTYMGKGVNQGPTMGSMFSATSPITKSFGRNEIVLFRTPTALEKKSENINLTFESLAQTTSNSMAFESLKIAGQGPVGPFTLAYAVNGKISDDSAKPFYAVVIGDSDFFTNSMLYQNLNRDLVLNSVAALAKEENLISVTAKEPQITKMLLTDTNFAIFLFAFILPLPIILLSTGVTLWFKRRSA